MQSSKINVEKLVNITVEIILTTSFDEVWKIKPTRKEDQTNIWNILCLKYFGFIKYNHALRIFQWWMRDTNSYSSLTKSTLKAISDQKSVEKMEVDSKERKIALPLTPDEWKFNNIYVVTYNERSNFTNDFFKFFE